MELKRRLNIGFSALTSTLKVWVPCEKNTGMTEYLGWGNGPVGKMPTNKYEDFHSNPHYPYKKPGVGTTIL